MTEFQRPKVSVESATANGINVIVGNIRIYAYKTENDDEIYEIYSNGKTVQVQP